MKLIQTNKTNQTPELFVSNLIGRIFIQLVDFVIKAGIIKVILHEDIQGCLSKKTGAVLECPRAEGPFAGEDIALTAPG